MQWRTASTHRPSRGTRSCPEPTSRFHRPEAIVGRRVAPASSAAFTTRPSPVVGDERDVATRQRIEPVEAVTSGPIRRNSVPDAGAAMSGASRSRGRHEPWVDAGRPPVRPSPAEAVGSDDSGATIEAARTPSDSHDSVPDGSFRGEQRTSRRSTSSGDLAQHPAPRRRDERSSDPADPVAHDAPAAALRSPRTTSRDRPPTGRTDGHVGEDQHHDVDLPSGALGELVRRWGEPASRPTPDRLDAGDSATTYRVAPDAELRRPTVPTTAPGRRPDHRSPDGDEIPAGDEHLLDLLDVALTELFRRDAERHGLGGLLS